MSQTKEPYKITVGTSAVALVDPVTPSGVRLRARTIKNIGAGTVYLGGPAVTGATNGYPLATGEAFPDTLSNHLIYAISASGSNDVIVWEVIN